MKRIILLSFLSLTCLKSFSQNVDYIEKYHKIVLKAELLLLENKCDSSLYYYQKAFSNVPYTFASDFKNAAYTAYLCENKELARQYIDSASVRGMPIKKRLKKYYTNKADWVYFSTIKYNQLINKGTGKTDSSMIHLIDSLYIEDQSVRQSKTYDLSWQNRCTETDSLIAECLRLYLLTGKISEGSLGRDAYRKFSIILFHYLFINDQDLIKKLYKNGCIDKGDFFYCITRPAQWGKKTDFLVPEMLKNDKYQIITDEIDNKRKEYGIPSVEQTKNLMKLRKKSSDLFYFNLKWY